MENNSYKAFVPASNFKLFFLLKIRINNLGYEVKIQN